MIKHFINLQFTLIFLFIITLLSCGQREYKKIELSALEPKLRQRSDRIANDFFTLCTTQDGLREFKSKNYITPLVHAAIASPTGYYAYAPEILNINLGQIYSWKLFQSIDKVDITSMRYKVDCEYRNDEFVEFKIDINMDNNLASMYIYVYVDKETKTRKNLFFK